jgi:GNAT superfamily N-acetyltransferase
VACRGPDIVGFYSLSVGSVNRETAIKALQRNMPDPIPVMVLGRLAVHRTQQGRGIGQGLLKDAILRTLAVSENAGVAALLVHAKHERAAEFYRKWDFQQSPIHDLTYMLSFNQMIAVCSQPNPL